jgi:hypothetical protein
MVVPFVPAFGCSKRDCSHFASASLNLLSAVASRQETTSAGRGGGQIYFDLALTYFRITKVHSCSTTKSHFSASSNCRAVPFSRWSLNRQPPGATMRLNRALISVLGEIGNHRRQIVKVCIAIAEEQNPGDARSTHSLCPAQPQSCCAYTQRQHC